MRIFIVKKDHYLADFSMKFSINAMAYTEREDADAYLGRYLARKSKADFEVNELKGGFFQILDTEDRTFVIAYIEELEVFDV